MKQATQADQPGEDQTLTEVEVCHEAKTKLELSMKRLEEETTVNWTECHRGGGGGGVNSEELTHSNMMVIYYQVDTEEIEHFKDASFGKMVSLKTNDKHLHMSS